MIHDSHSSKAIKAGLSCNMHGGSHMLPCAWIKGGMPCYIHGVCHMVPCGSIKFLMRCYEYFSFSVHPKFLTSCVNRRLFCICKFRGKIKIDTSTELHAPYIAIYPVSIRWYTIYLIFFYFKENKWIWNDVFIHQTINYIYIINSKSTVFFLIFENIFTDREGEAN